MLAIMMMQVIDDTSNGCNEMKQTAVIYKLLYALCCRYNYRITLYNLRMSHAQFTLQLYVMGQAQ